MKEYAVTYYDANAESIDCDILTVDEPDVLMESFLRLESNPEIVKVIVRLVTENGLSGVPFAVINKVVS